MSCHAPVRSARPVADTASTCASQFTREQIAALEADARTSASYYLIGRVCDESTKQPISGGMIDLVNTDWRAITDSTGHYRLTRLPVGHYEARFRRIGYYLEIRQVFVSSGAVQYLDAEGRDRSPRGIWLTFAARSTGL
jgi:hypothetical protein